MTTGRKKYVPRIVIDELEDMKQEHNITEDHIAMKKMIEYTRMGRQVERIMKLDFRHPPTGRIFNKKKRGKSIFEL